MSDQFYRHISFRVRYGVSAIGSIGLSGLGFVMVVSVIYRLGLLGFKCVTEYAISSIGLSRLGLVMVCL